MFFKRFEQLFNFANSIIFTKSKNCSKHPEKICMYFLTNFKNFLFLVIFAIFSFKKKILKDQISI